MNRLRSKICNSAFLRRLEGGCSVPAAVQSSYDVATGTLAFAGSVYSLDGDRHVHERCAPTACADVVAARAIGYVLVGRVRLRPRAKA